MKKIFLKKILIKIYWKKTCFIIKKHLVFLGKNSQNLKKLFGSLKNIFFKLVFSKNVKDSKI